MHNYQKPCFLASQYLLQCTLKKSNVLVLRNTESFVCRIWFWTAAGWHWAALGSDLLSLFVETQHTSLHIVYVRFCWVRGCVCTALFVCQPIWQYLLSLLQALVLPCCLRSAAALWCPLIIMPEDNGDYECNWTKQERVTVKYYCGWCDRVIGGWSNNISKC